ncbi:MAG: hypothetical protein OXG84_07900 [Chloroflexi bacterium]|nr:hypothetical protein [Chloroflexota bacterium]
MTARLPERKRRLRCWLPLICLPLILTNLLVAQDTGQVCVQSFEDRDADGTRDADEWSVTRGIGAGLRNVAGVTIASRLLEDSPFAARGLICFEQLLAGDYQITMTSAEFAGTAASTFAASVNPGAAPALIEYGVRPLQAASGSAKPGISLDAEAADALAIALIGSMTAGAAMSVVGLLIFLLILRRRSQRASPAPTVRGKAPPPFASHADVDPLHKLAPSADSPPLFADEEIDAPRRAES